MDTEHEPADPVLDLTGCEGYLVETEPARENLAVVLILRVPTGQPTI